MALTPFGDTIWLAQQPLKFMGIHIGTRMTVVKLPDGGLFIHSPISLDDELKAEIDAIGPVQHIVAPNRYHHLFAGHFKAAYPEAKLHAAAGLDKKRSDLAIDEILSETADPGWNGVLEPVAINGCVLGETVFMHSPSRTLISCDLVENFPSAPGWLTRTYLRMGGIYGKPGVHRVLRMMFRDKKAGRRSIDAVLEHDFDRAVISHGEPLAENAHQILRESYQWMK